MKTEIQIFGLSDEAFENFRKENWAVINAKVAWNECRTRALAQIEFLSRENEKLKRELDSFYEQEAGESL